MKIVLKQWQIGEVENEKKIGGEFAVMAGATEVATKTFNKGSYNEAKVNIPPQLMVEALALTEKIEKAVQENYLGKE